MTTAVVVSVYPAAPPSLPVVVDAVTAAVVDVLLPDTAVISPDTAVVCTSAVVWDEKMVAGLASTLVFTGTAVVTVLVTAAVLDEAVVIFTVSVGTVVLSETGAVVSVLPSVMEVTITSSVVVTVAVGSVSSEEPLPSRTGMYPS